MAIDVQRRQEFNDDDVIGKTNDDATATATRSSSRVVANADVADGDRINDIGELRNVLLGALCVYEWYRNVCSYDTVVCTVKYTTTTYDVSSWCRGVVIRREFFYIFFCFLKKGSDFWDHRKLRLG